MAEHLSFDKLVLLADDDINDRILFNDAINQLDSGIVLKMFDNGHALMSYLLDRKNRLPDYVFLDLCMPAKSGIDCLDEIRKHERLSNLRVIIYSTSSHVEDINETLNKGANLYFAKSSTFQELINRLRRIFGMNWEEFDPVTTIERFVLTEEVGI